MYSKCRKFSLEQYFYGSNVSPIGVATGPAHVGRGLTYKKYLIPIRGNHSKFCNCTS